jgi:hypothetical protein
VRDLRRGSPRGVLPRAGRANAAGPSLSADGRYLAFQINPGYASAKLYLRDLRLGASAFIDHGGNYDSALDLSADGRYLAYDTLTSSDRGSGGCGVPGALPLPPEYTPAEATTSCTRARRFFGAVYRTANPFE